MMLIPNRKDYLSRQAQKGQKIMGVLPALYPRELLWAFDILPAEIWDPPDKILAANTHLQTTICPVVKHGLERILKNSSLVTAGYLIPHTCDSLQNLASLVRDLMGTTVPVHIFYNPKGAFNRTSQAYYQAILKTFEQELARIYGPLSADRLTAACHLGHAIDQHLARILEARREQRVDLTNTAFFRLLRAGEYLSGPDYLELLQTVPVRDKPRSDLPRRLLVSGILPPHETVLTFLDELGVSITADDLLSVSRRLPRIHLDPPKNPISSPIMAKTKSV
jgi:benzoyl-CoA reductase/2-hydroxyglutaryl-CoA dehydratase subunit BcrC/BadD/HgdB